MYQREGVRTSGQLGRCPRERARPTCTACQVSPRARAEPPAAPGALGRLARPASGLRAGSPGLRLSSRAGFQRRLSHLGTHLPPRLDDGVRTSPLSQVIPSPLALRKGGAPPRSWGEGVSSPRPPPPSSEHSRRDREAGPGASEGSGRAPDSPNRRAVLSVRSPGSRRVYAEGSCGLVAPHLAGRPGSRRGRRGSAWGKRALSEQAALSRGRGGRGAGAPRRRAGRGRWRAGAGGCSAPARPAPAHSPRPLARSPASPAPRLAPPPSRGLGGSRAPGEAPRRARGRADDRRPRGKPSARSSRAGLCGLPRRASLAAADQPGPWPPPRRPAGDYEPESAALPGPLLSAWAWSTSGSGKAACTPHARPGKVGVSRGGAGAVASRRRVANLVGSADRRRWVRCGNGAHRGPPAGASPRGAHSSRDIGRPGNAPRE